MILCACAWDKDEQKCLNMSNQASLLFVSLQWRRIDKVRAHIKLNRYIVLYLIVNDTLKRLVIDKYCLLVLLTPRQEMVVENIVEVILGVVSLTMSNYSAKLLYFWSISASKTHNIYYSSISKQSHLAEMYQSKYCTPHSAIAQEPDMGGR